MTTETAAGEELRFITTVHRPRAADMHLGFAYRFQAERACWSLTSSLTNTAHIEGTAITWAPRTTQREVWEPLHTDPSSIAELIKTEQISGEPRDRFPDLFIRLQAPEGCAEADAIGKAACALLAFEEQPEDAAQTYELDLAAAWAVLNASGRYSIKDNLTGEWME